MSELTETNITVRVNASDSRRAPKPDRLVPVVGHLVGGTPLAVTPFVLWDAGAQKPEIHVDTMVVTHAASGLRIGDGAFASIERAAAYARCVYDADPGAWAEVPQDIENRSALPREIAARLRKARRTADAQEAAYDLDHLEEGAQ